MNGDSEGGFAPHPRSEGAPDRRAPASGAPSETGGSAPERERTPKHSIARAKPALEARLVRHAKPALELR